MPTKDFYMYSELKGKVAVITVGSKGIVTAIAKRFGQEGMKVVINYISDAAGSELAAEAVRCARGEAVAVKAHVGTEEGVQSLVDAAVENYGGIDVWINNAGMENKISTHEMPLSDWERVINVNLTGVFLGTRAALVYFMEHNVTGSIINMSSVMSRFPGRPLHITVRPKAV